MQLKELFTVPAGEKITEQCLRRVLVSSICSILLCMTCLVTTTWAWFTVSIETTEVIEIADQVQLEQTTNLAAESSGDAAGETAAPSETEAATDPAETSTPTAPQETTEIS